MADVAQTSDSSCEIDSAAQNFIVRTMLDSFWSLLSDVIVEWLSSKLVAILCDYQGF